MRIDWRIFFLFLWMFYFLIFSYHRLGFLDPALNVINAHFVNGQHLFTKACLFTFWEKIGQFDIFVCKFNKCFFRYVFYFIFGWLLNLRTVLPSFFSVERQCEVN